MVLVSANMSRFGFSPCKKNCRKRSLQNILFLKNKIFCRDFLKNKIFCRTFFYKLT